MAVVLANYDGSFRVEAYRNDPFLLTGRVNGDNLDGAVLEFSIGIEPGVPLSPPRTFGRTDQEGADGVRVVDTGVDADGIAWADFEIFLAKLTIQNLPASVEPELPAELWCELEWKLADDASGFSEVETTIFQTTFTVKGSIND